jgi:hypothetical protein
MMKSHGTAPYNLSVDVSKLYGKYFLYLSCLLFLIEVLNCLMLYRQRNLDGSQMRPVTH